MPIQTISRHTGGERDALCARASVVKEHGNETTKSLAAMISNVLKSLVFVADAAMPSNLISLDRISQLHNRARQSNENRR